MKEYTVKFERKIRVNADTTNEAIILASDQLWNELLSNGIMDALGGDIFSEEEIPDDELRDDGVAEADILFASEKFKSGEYQTYENGQELGRCRECQDIYVKSVGESNISRSGYCFNCGFNP